MVGDGDQQRLDRVLREMLRALCKVSIAYSDEIKVQGTVCITVDKRGIYVVQLNETVTGDAEVNARPPEFGQHVTVKSEFLLAPLVLKNEGNPDDVVLVSDESDSDQNNNTYEEFQLNKEAGFNHQVLTESEATTSASVLQQASGKSVRYKSAAAVAAKKSANVGVTRANLLVPVKKLKSTHVNNLSLVSQENNLKLIEKNVEKLSSSARKRQNDDSFAGATENESDSDDCTVIQHTPAVKKVG